MRSYVYILLLGAALLTLALVVRSGSTGWSGREGSLPLILSMKSPLILSCSPKIGSGIVPACLTKLSYERTPPIKSWCTSPPTPSAYPGTVSAVADASFPTKATASCASVCGSAVVTVAPWVTMLV